LILSTLKGGYHPPPPSLRDICPRQDRRVLEAGIAPSRYADKNSQILNIPKKSPRKITRFCDIHIPPIFPPFAPEV